MELALNNGFMEMSMDETLVVDGGGVVSDVVNGVTGIWDSWCNMWYEAGKHTYNWTHK